MTPDIPDDPRFWSPIELRDLSKCLDGTYSGEFRWGIFPYYLRNWRKDSDGVLRGEICEHPDPRKEQYFREMDAIRGAG